MKKRFGFVSNSSSTSFIVTTDKESDGEIEVTLKVKINLHDFKNENHGVIKTKKDLDSYFFDSSYVKSIDELSDTDKGIYAKCIKSLKEKKMVFICEFSDSGDGGYGIERFIAEKGLQSTSDRIEVLDRWRC